MAALSTQGDRGERSSQNAEARYKKASTIFCSQFDVPGWRVKIGDPIFADAICDRIVHDSYSIVIDCKKIIIVTKMLGGEIKCLAVILPFDLCYTQSRYLPFACKAESQELFGFLYVVQKLHDYANPHHGFECCERSPHGFRCSQGSSQSPNFDTRQMYSFSCLASLTAKLIHLHYRFLDCFFTFKLFHVQIGDALIVTP